jgi:hypothetical protein
MQIREMELALLAAAPVRCERRSWKPMRILALINFLTNGKLWTDPCGRRGRGCATGDLDILDSLTLTGAAAVLQY